MKAFLLALGGLVALCPATRAQTYTLDLSGLTLDVPGRHVAVEVVMDARPGSPALGMAYRGLSNQSVPIGFRQGPAIALTQFLQAQLPARPTDHQVLLCLRALHVSETKGGFREQATADMTADVYERRPDGYHFVQQITAQARDEGNEVTRWHAPHVARMLAEALGQLDQADWLAVGPARTLAELSTDAPLPASGRRRPAILREAPRRGLYYRLDQFLKNQPDTLTRFVVDTIQARFASPLATLQWRGVARLKPLLLDAAGHRVAKPGLWGFSDGRQAFVCQDQEFFPLLRQGNSFVFVGEAPPDELYMLAQARAQARANLTVVARVGAVDHTGEPTAYSLDMRSGAIVRYPGPGVPARADTAYLYLYRPLHAAHPAPLNVYVNGREAGTLRPGQYLEVPWARAGQALKLCLSGLRLASPCQFVLPNTSQQNYLKVDDTSSGQPWQWMPPTQGAADLDELDKQAGESR